MAGRICPWWHAYTFDNVLRRLFQKPERIFAPYLKPGMSVMDIGCGMGFFAIGAAKIVGDEGLVIAVDLQQKMLDVLQKRARRAGVDHRIRTHLCRADSLGMDEIVEIVDSVDSVDFVLAFYMVHEVPDQRGLLEQVHACLKPDGKLLVAEPNFHVSVKAFQETLSTAGKVGFRLQDQPGIKGSRSAVFGKQ